ncbi:hypothetical protein DFJ63DRAFT_25599 [Scheffersomyces coipomensis]|uniref:uncharacterized protein n=1 Tax=Scheffersomyces coipomensis TaxID=1788519 RepID=UPI00315C9F33
MRIAAILTACLSIATIAKSTAVAEPASDEFELDLVQRGLLTDVLDIGESLLKDINFEGIAGWVNNILTENDHVKYLDDLLIGLKDIGLVPVAAEFIISNNYTRTIAGHVIVDALKVGETLNLTSLWIALDDSGLAYDLIAGIIEDPNTFPSILTIIKKFIATGDLSLGGIIGDAGNIIEGLYGGGIGSNTTTKAATTTTKEGLFGFLTDGAKTTALSNTTTTTKAGLFAFLTDGDKSATTTTAATSTTTKAGLFAFLTDGAATTSATTAASTTTTKAGLFAFLTDGAATTTTAAPIATSGANSINLGELDSAISANGIATSSLAGNLQGVVTDNSYLASLNTREEELAIQIAKRDNIEALLQTIFASVDRSGLLNETINALLINENFQDATVILLSDFFENLLHGDVHIQIAPLIPTVKSLLASGIVEHIFEKAIKDPTLKAAIENDIKSLFSSGSSSSKEVVIPGVAKQDIFSALVSAGESVFISSIEADITNALETMASFTTDVASNTAEPTSSFSHSTVQKSVSIPSSSATTSSGSSNGSPNVTPLGSGLLHILAAGFMILI